MARSVTFGGITQFKPGAITKINARALTPIGLSTNGIIALIGEADGGKPGEVIAIDDPALAKEAFRSGPLADAIRLAFDPSNDARTPSGAFRVLAYKTNASTQSSTQLAGDEAVVADTVAAASTATVINLTTGGLTVGAHVGRWLQHVTSGEIRRITANAASSVTVSPGFSFVPATSDAVNVLYSQLVVTSKDYGEHTNQVAVEVEEGVTAGTFVATVTFEDIVEQSGDLGGSSFLNIRYAGGAVLDSGTVLSTTASEVTFGTLAGGGTAAANEYDGRVIQFANGIQRLVLSHTTGTAPVVTLAVGHYLTTDEQADVTGTVASMRDVTAATVSVTGANGLSTGMTSTVSPANDPLSVAGPFTFSSGETLRQLVDRINSTTNYVASVPAGVNPDTVLMSTYDFGTRATSVDVRFDAAIDPVNKGTFRRDLQVLVDHLNLSDLVTAVKASVGSDEGSELPAFTGGVAGSVLDAPVYLIGAVAGSSSSAAFQAAFDAMLLVRANHIVPLISADLGGNNARFSSVAAQLLSHVATANAGGKNERGGYLGMAGTRAQLIAQAAKLNSADVQLFGEKHTVLNVDGSLVEQPEWSAAVLAAGMRGGAIEVGEPLTFKFVKTFGVTRDSSWNPKSITDVNALIAGGVMFSEVGPNGGFRWVRDITTHLADDNIAFIDAHTRDAVRYIAYEFRTFLENTFTGLKATPATVATIREQAGVKLQLLREENVLVDSLDPEDLNSTTVIPGFRRLRVSVSGNIASIKVEVFPVTGIVFELVDIFLQLPRL